MVKAVVTRSPEETMDAASRVAEGIGGRGFVALIGDLGTGKTVFVKGLAKALGVSDYRYVNSPSFVVLKEYQGKSPLYHFDIYRLESESFSETVDYRKYFYGGGLTVVEWADKVKDIIPDEYLEIRMFYGNSENERRIEFRAIGAKYEKAVKGIEHRA
ncbi:MAG: tRNA (adenosine(37)-N6)-threonylcarbamoyltransferase complex ATPase subunit type 1 TsaE [Candidatus Omnitrophota bacterium]